MSHSVHETSLHGVEERILHMVGWVNVSLGWPINPKGVRKDPPGSWVGKCLTQFVNHPSAGWVGVSLGQSPTGWWDLRIDMRLQDCLVNK